ncbi:hypothetical protein ACFE04_007419 [Oxalis oulophora]
MESTTTKTKLIKTNDNYKFHKRNNNNNNNNRSGSFGSNSSLFSCCNKSVDDDIATLTTNTTYHDGSGLAKSIIKQKNININAMGEKDGRGLPPPPQVLTDDKDNFTKKKKVKESHRKLARIMKAVFCETALAKRMRKNMLRPKLYQQDSKSSGRSEDVSRPLSRVSSNPSLISKESYHKTLPKSCSSSTLYSTSSRLSGPLSAMLPPSLLKKPNAKKRCYGYDTALGMILISLVILLIWGKSCAMFWTVTWLIFVPRLSNIANSSAHINAKTEFEINCSENSMKSLHDH